MSLDSRTDPSCGRLLITATGRFDTESCEQLRKQLKRTLRGTGQSVVVDLSRMRTEDTNVDFLAVAIVAAAADKTKVSGGSLRLVTSNSDIDDIIDSAGRHELTGVGRV